MQVLITGSNGFLGYHLCELLLRKGHQVIATGKGECRLPFSSNVNFTYVQLDFTDEEKVASFFLTHQPSIVIHAGAMSKPDECELQPALAHSVNVKGTQYLLETSATCRSFFIFLSTDFIFNGEKGMYSEEDEPGPINYYGKTKLEAESLVKEYVHGWSIVRTVLVYGPNFSGRKNILGVIREKLEKGEEYKIVNDQIRTPTYVEDLAIGIITIAEKKAAGLYHISGEEVLTPFQMADQTARFFGLDSSIFKQVNASTFTEPAKRPLKTGFNISKAKRELGFSPDTFEEGLRKTFPDQK